jgi:hypothetical protein
MSDLMEKNLLERVVHDGRRRRHEGRKELEGLLTMSLHGGVGGGRPARHDGRMAVCTLNLPALKLK